MPSAPSTAPSTAPPTAPPWPSLQQSQQFPQKNTTNDNSYDSPPTYDETQKRQI